MSWLVHRILIFVISRFVLIHQLIDARVIWKNDISLSSNSLSSDLERIPQELLDSLSLHVDEGQFERLHNFLGNLPKPKPEYHEVAFEDYDYHYDYDVLTSDRNESRKREVDGSTDYDKTTDAFINGTVKELDYNLEELKNEYEIITLPEPDIKTPVALDGLSSPQPDDKPFEASDKKENINRCMRMSTWKYIFFGFPCFWSTVKNLGEGGRLWEALVILMRTLFSWIILYVVIATTLWCYKGSCCCCIHLSILHPDEMMKKIKNKALLNPPGVEKLPDGSVKKYQPSKEETKAYKRLMDQLYS